MEDLSMILGLLQAHPVIAIALAAYLLFFRGSSKGSATGGSTFSNILTQVLKFLLSRLEPQPDPGPGPAPAPIDRADFLKKLIDEFLKAKASGDKDHEEALLKVMAKCEHCQE